MTTKEMMDKLAKVIQQQQVKLCEESIKRFEEYERMFGPAQWIWPKKSKVQDLMEDWVTRGWLVWDALVGRVQDLGDGFGVAVRVVDLNWLFRRKRIENPEYAKWLAKEGNKKKVEVSRNMFRIPINTLKVENFKRE